MNMHCPDALEVEDVEGSSVVGGTVGARVVVRLVVPVTVVPVLVTETVVPVPVTVAVVWVAVSVLVAVTVVPVTVRVAVADVGEVVWVTVVGIVKTLRKFTALTSAPWAEAPHAWPCRLRSTARNARELAQTSVTPVKSSVLQLPP